jgi:hypothetical protein
MNFSFGASVTIAMWVLFLYQLTAGKALSPRGIWAAKDGCPSRYWISVYVQSLFVLVLTALATDFFFAAVP